MTLPPQQPRSQRTLEDLLDAAAALLEEKSFDEMTINDIVTRAGSSVGSFYARFKDKDALLFALDERFIDGYIAAGQAWVAGQQASPAANLSETIHSLMNQVYELHQANLGLLRTLILRARLYPDPRFREQETRLNENLPGIVEILLAHRAEITHPNPEIAVPLGFLQTFLAMRETLTWSHIGTNMPVQGEEYVAELAKLYLGYLRT